MANEVGRITATIGNNSEEIVIIFTPHGSVNTDMVSQGDCAAHYNSQGLNFLSVNHSYTYITMPYNPDQAGCGANSVSNVLDGVSIFLGHEFAETITDPYSGFAFDFGSETGWVAPNGLEIGDLCAWQDLMDTPAVG